MFRPRYNINDYARSYRMQNIWGYVEGSAQQKSQKKKWRVEKEAPYRLYRGGEGEGLESKETRDSRLSEAKRGCRTAVFHGRFGSDVDRDDKRERRTVTGRREKERSLLTPHLPSSWSVFKVFYFQRDVRGWKTKGMGWQIKEQRKLHSERILSLSLPPLPPFLLFPLFFLSSSVCSLCNVFPLVPIALFHPIPSPHVRPNDCPSAATLRGSTIFWLEKKTGFYISRKNGRKENGERLRNKTGEKKDTFVPRIFYSTSFPIFPFFPGHEILKLPSLLPVILII